MKRSTGTEKLLYRVASALIVIACLGAAVATVALTWSVYSDLTRDIQPERQVPHISRENVTKALDILKQKESSVKIDLKTREVKFGKTEPFD